jgi:integrase
MWKDYGLVFTNMKGKRGWPVNSRSLLKHLKNILKLARFDTSMSLYSLRHSYAPRFMRKVHPKLVSARLGHSSVAITMDICTHVIPIDYGDTEAIESVLNPTGTGTYSACAHFEAEGEWSQSIEN